MLMNLEDLFRFHPYLDEQTFKKLPHPNDVRASSHITSYKRFKSKINFNFKPRLKVLEYDELP